MFRLCATRHSQLRHRRLVQKLNTKHDASRLSAFTSDAIDMTAHSRPFIHIASNPPRTIAA